MGADAGVGAVHSPLPRILEKNKMKNKSSYLRHCATSRKVTGSIPDEVKGIFN
jgi:hypothetical protein